MTRHSKNNTASSTFTYAEKEKLKYGTQKQRLGRDSLRDYDACFLCLQTARDPLCCPNGHVACKECYYTNILAQKTEIAQSLKISDQKRMALQLERQSKEKQAQQTIATEFELSQTNLHSITRHTAAANSSLAASANSPADSHTSGVSNKPLVDAAAIAASRDAERLGALQSLENDATENAKSKLPSFWVPHLTPETKGSIGEVEKKHPSCTASTSPHTISVKKLTPVNFSTSSASSASTSANERRNARICPACSRQLSNGMRLSLSKRCGHVLCRKCTDQFTRASQQCFVCNMKCKDRDIIELSSEGTGFAAAGGTVEVVKYDTAFIG